MTYERPRRPEIDPEQLQRFATTFVPRFDTYTFQLDDGNYVRAGRREKTADMFLPSPLTSGHLEGHLKGHITIGAYMLAPDNSATKICFDADEEKEFSELRALAQSLARSGVPSYLELSRRGGHLWLFTPMLSGTEARRFGKQLLREHHITQMELYPKQERLTERNPVGSLVRLPLGKHRGITPPQRYHFVSHDGEPLAESIAQYLTILANPERVPQTFVDRVLAVAPDLTPTFKLKRRITGTELSERIKNAIHIEDYIGQYVELTPSGRGYCPFHDDQKMSFSVKKGDDYYNCFAPTCPCKRGSIIDFEISMRQMYGQSTEWKAVLRAMADKLGL